MRVHSWATAVVVGAAATMLSACPPPPPPPPTTSTRGPYTVTVTVKPPDTWVYNISVAAGSDYSYFELIAPIDPSACQATPPGTSFVYAPPPDSGSIVFAGMVAFTTPSNFTVACEGKTNGPVYVIVRGKGPRGPVGATLGPVAGPT